MNHVSTDWCSGTLPVNHTEGIPIVKNGVCLSQTCYKYKCYDIGSRRSRRDVCDTDPSHNNKAWVTQTRNRAHRPYTVFIQNPSRLRRSPAAIFRHIINITIILIYFMDMCCLFSEHLELNRIHVYMTSLHFCHNLTSNCGIVKQITSRFVLNLI